MFLCAPPFIRSFGSSIAGPYEFTITIATINAGAGQYGYSDPAYGSIDVHSDVVKAIVVTNPSNSWQIQIKSDAPITPATGAGSHFNLYIVSGASSTGVYLPDGGGVSDYFGAYYVETKTTSIDLNTSGTATFILDYTAA